MIPKTFPLLFSPGSIGKLEIRNRIVMPALGTGLATPEGMVTERMLAYFEARAQGGAGLIITDTASIVPVPGAVLRALDVSSDACIAGLKNLVKVIHQHGAKAGLQLWHPGRQVSPPLTGQLPAVAPSPIPCPVCKTTPRELSREEIEGMVLLFAQAGVRAAEAGYDLIEIHGAHGYLVSQFLSPNTNQRSDDYGGDVTRRSKLLLDIIGQIKLRLGRDFPVSCRINGADFTTSGLSLDEAKQVAGLLAGKGIDAVSVSAGSYGSYPAIIPPVMDPPGCYVRLAAGIKAVSSVPVIATGRINQPYLAEDILAHGRADFVAMGRALLADPDLPNKALEGKVGEIRPCVACNKLCADAINTGNRNFISCAFNPLVGREKEITFKVSPRRKRILVAGGGPAGLKFANLASLKKHEVLLFEKEPLLGGHFRLAAIPPGKEEFLRAIEYLERCLSGVDIRLGTEVTVEIIRDINPEVIIVATGAVAVTPDIPGVYAANVVQAFSVLRGSCAIGQRVLVVGGGGVGLETAAYLGKGGHRVTVAEMRPRVGEDLGPIFRWYLNKELESYGVEIMTGTRVTGIEGKDVIFSHSARRVEKIGFDTVVLAAGLVPNNRLSAELAGKGYEVHEIGDVRQPRSAAEAVAEALELAGKI